MFGFGPYGHHFERRERMVEKGALKYVILDLLKDKPAHGYEIIKALEERFHGFYSPSAGSVYPTLQLLEDMGYVTSAERDGKKVYTITDEGRKHLADEKEHVEGIKEHMHGYWGPYAHSEFRDTFMELRGLGRMFREHARDLSEDQWKRIRQIVHDAAGQIADVIGH
jgi:DNA-binding PadR family transcriptional regulator